MTHASARVHPATVVAPASRRCSSAMESRRYGSCIRLPESKLFAAIVVTAIMVATAPLPARGDHSPRPDSAVSRAEQQRIDVIARVSPTVVCIVDENFGGGGSGVLISPDGYGLSNFHVLAPALQTGKAFGGLADGQLYPLEVLGIDPTGDVAMFKLTGRDRFDAALLGDSDRVAVGDPVLALGNPFMLAEDYTPTATFGIISGTGRYQYGADERALVYTDCLQIDASINPGNSGGPLFDLHGRLIGINGRASFARRGRVNVGLAYAISINQIKRFLPGLKAGFLIEHGALGATAIDAGYRRVVFEQVPPDSAAARAGIRAGDRLSRFAGHEMHSANQFTNLLGTFPLGWPVKVAWEREGQTQQQRIHLDRLPANVPKPMQALIEKIPVLGEQEARAFWADAAADTSAPPARPNAFPPPIEHALDCTVKIHGAKIAAEQGYAGGLIVSAVGEVVTPLSVALEAANLRAVTRDGHIYSAEVVTRDEYRQLALLKLAAFPQNPDTTATVHEQMTPARFQPFNPGRSAELKTGDWIFVVGNPFKVADGPEPMSVTRGIVADRTILEAVRESRDFPYRGEVILLDAVTSNPGSAGSAVVDMDGRIIGLVGESVTARQTNTFANYAYPIEEIEAFLADTAPKPPETPIKRKPGYHGLTLSRIGYRQRLPFVGRVDADSPAGQAGIQPGDLIVSANGVAIPGQRIFEELGEQLSAGDILNLVIKRGEQLLTLNITLTEPPK